MGFADWFAIKSPAQRKKEAQKYDKWAFPYGPRQKEKLQTILKELMPEEDALSGMAVYLIGREAYQGSFKEDPEDTAERSVYRKMQTLDSALREQLRGKLKKRIPYYKAMVLADAAVDENLNYPSIEELRKAAEDLAE